MPIDKLEIDIELNEIKIDCKSEIDMESVSKVEIQKENMMQQQEIEVQVRQNMELLRLNTQMEIDKEIEIQREKSKQMEIDKEIEIQREKSKQMEIEMKIHEMNMKSRQMEIDKEIRQMEIEIRQMEIQKEIEIEREKTKQMQWKDGNSSSSQPNVYSSEEGAFATIAGSLEKITDVSACAIANNNRDYYDPFTVPCSNEVYIPNTRLRRLRNKLKSAEVLPCSAHSIPLTIMEMQRTWKYPSGGSETIVNHPNLKVFLSAILSSYNKDCDIHSDVVINNDYLGINSRFIFASDKSKPEHVLMHGNCVLLGTEAKGANASNIEAGMQCFQICADSAIELYRNGMIREECVVPGVIIYGEVFHIVGVYLISSTFPVMVNLSSEIYITNVEVLSTWVDVLKEFISETVTLLKNSQQRSESSKIICHLDAGFFYKPIRKTALNNFLVSNQRIILSRMMMIYEKLFNVIETEGSSPDNVIQFPIGLVTVPMSNTIHAKGIREALLHCIKRFFDHRNGINYNYDNDPCLIFHFLDSKEGWTNYRPDNDHRDSYIQQLRTAINILNSAGVVHMDLRPANIMWRSKNTSIGNKEVELKIIDFEDALMVGTVMNEALARVYSNDPRYPIKEGIDCTNVSTKIEFNNFFVDAIEAWLTKSEEKEFITYMRMNKGTMTYYD